MFNFDKAVEVIKSGGLVVMPTDTVYGVCAQATNKEAVSRLYALKKRENKPGTLIAASIDQLVELGIKRRYLKAVEQFWPAPLSIVIPTGFDLGYLDLGKGTLAMRIVNDSQIAKLLQITGPLLTTSANLPGQKEATNIDEAKAYFGDKIDLYVDGGDETGVKSSTVIRIVDDAIEVLREGAVKINEKGEVTP